jgi:hypothetical protein
MGKEVLNQKQLDLLPLVESFCDKGFYLAGGTALALQTGHRESIDFDLFKYEDFKNQDILHEVRSLLKNKSIEVLIDILDEYTCLIDGVKVTFLRYPFKIDNIINIEDICVADKLTIGAMKAYALGRRAKWKDYVDIYTLLQESDLDTICNIANDIFGTLFSRKNFLQQLSFFDDIDYSEEVIWRKDNPPSKDDVKNFLKNISVEALR